MIQLYFGDGKGKTTASVGLAVRAAGHGKRVLFVQFMKGRNSGELKILNRVPWIRILRADNSTRFTFEMDEEEKKVAAQINQQLMNEAFDLGEGSDVQIMILDEAVTAVHTGLLSGEQLKERVREWPKDRELILTGAAPEKWMIEMADYVTEMKKIDHPFDQGILAREGIEY